MQWVACQGNARWRASSASAAPLLCYFLGAKMASYGLVKQEPDAAAALYTES